MQASLKVDQLNKEINVAELVDEILEEYKLSPVLLAPNETALSAITYLQTLRSSYVRTLEDVAEWTKGKSPSSIRILEIGAFTGLISICLSQLGYQVVATDMPEFIASEQLQEKLRMKDISSFGCDLSELVIPAQDHEYDLVIMCEVLEHLNFNPLPLVKEINRIIKINGLFYLSLPNIASLKNRLLLLEGKSIHNPIQHLVWQTDPNSTMKIGLHWREYTLHEVDEILSMFGFKPERHYYFDWFDKVTFKDKKPLVSSLKFPFKKALYRLFPDLKENQTVLARKIEDA